MLNLNEMRNIVIFLSMMSISTATWGLDIEDVNQSLNTASEKIDLTLDDIRNISTAVKNGTLKFYSTSKENLLENSQEITLTGGGIIIGGVLVNRLAKSSVENTGTRFGAALAKYIPSLNRYSNSIGGFKDAIEFIDDGTAILADDVPISRSASQKNAMKVGLLGLKDWMNDHGYRMIQSISKTAAKYIGTPVFFVGGSLWVFNSAATEKGLDEEISLEVMNNGEDLEEYVANTPHAEVLEAAKDDPKLKEALEVSSIVVKATNILDENVQQDPPEVSDLQGQNGEVQNFSTRAQVVVKSTDENIPAATAINE